MLLCQLSEAPVVVGLHSRTIARADCSDSCNRSSLLWRRAVLASRQWWPGLCRTTGVHAVGARERSVASPGYLSVAIPSPAAIAVPVRFLPFALAAVALHLIGPESPILRSAYSLDASAILVGVPAARPLALQPIVVVGVAPAPRRPIGALAPRSRPPVRLGNRRATINTQRRTAPITSTLPNILPSSFPFPSLKRRRGQGVSSPRPLRAREDVTYPAMLLAHAVPARCPYS